MANATADLLFDPYGQGGRRFHWPVTTAQAIYLGTMVAQGAGGLIVPASVAAAGRVIGVATHTIASATAAQRLVIETDRIFRFTNGSGANAFSEATPYGAPCYAFDDHTVYDNSNGDTLKLAGYFRGIDDSKVLVEIIGPDVGALDVSETGGDIVTSLRARNVVNGNVADLAAYTVASNAAVNDATLNVEGDVVLLVAQTTAAENAAPLTRHAAMFTGRVFRADDYDILIAAGTLFAHSRWFNSAAGTIGTNTPAFVPESVTQSRAFPVNTGLIVVDNVPILSATKTMLNVINIAEVTADLTVRYSRQPATVVAGALGLASITVMAEIAAGGVNVDDDSTLLVQIVNR
jgi:hypothetical protein